VILSLVVVLAVVAYFIFTLSGTGGGSPLDGQAVSPLVLSQLSGVAAPIITEYVVAATQSYALAFGISAAYLVVGICSYLFLLGRIEPVPAPAG